ncbi:MAG: TetR/AcrR family transcriptional regulator, partial [Candidatus Binataceae bacterium]
TKPGQLQICPRLREDQAENRRLPARADKKGFVDPRVSQVAENSGLSRSVVFKHFRDMESLRATLSRQLEERWAAMISEPDLAANTPERIGELVANQTALLEMVTPFRRAALIHEPFSKEIQTDLERARQATRRSLAAALAPELKTLPPHEQKALLDILHVLISWQSWESLRSNFECSVAQARALLAWAVRNLLEAALGHTGFPLESKTSNRRE